MAASYTDLALIDRMDSPPAEVRNPIIPLRQYGASSIAT